MIAYSRRKWYQTNIELYENKELNLSIRSTLIHDEPWFIAKDVCDALDISKHRDACSRLDEDERGSVLVDTLGGNQKILIISESGLYTLILRSRKPEL